MNADQRQALIAHLRENIATFEGWDIESELPVQICEDIVDGPLAPVIAALNAAARWRAALLIPDRDELVDSHYALLVALEAPLDRVWLGAS